MPTADSATSRPTNSSAARTRLAAILRSERSLPVPWTSCFSMAADTHSASTITSPAVIVPSIMLRSEMLALPTFQRTSSMASSSRGSTPVIHIATASHATHEMLRSSSAHPMGRAGT